MLLLWNCYEADQKRANIFTLFSLLMILIACLGLFGLASFTAEQRTKEIGVRKILGAETKDIVYLLTRNFILLVGLGGDSCLYRCLVFYETMASHFCLSYRNELLVIWCCFFNRYFDNAFDDGLSCFACCWRKSY